MLNKVFIAICFIEAHISFKLFEKKRHLLKNIDIIHIIILKRCQNLTFFKSIYFFNFYSGNIYTVQQENSSNAKTLKGLLGLFLIMDFLSFKSKRYI